MEITSGNVIEIELAGARIEIPANTSGLDYTHLLDQMAKALQSADCPNPLCVDGSIRNTGPDPQDDACEWCYARHDLISLSTYGRESHAVSVEPK